MMTDEIIEMLTLKREIFQLKSHIEGLTKELDFKNIMIDDRQWQEHWNKINENYKGDSPDQYMRFDEEGKPMQPKNIFAINSEYTKANNGMG